MTLTAVGYPRGTDIKKKKRKKKEKKKRGQNTGTDMRGRGVNSRQAWKGINCSCPWDWTGEKSATDVNPRTHIQEERRAISSWSDECFRIEGSHDADWRSGRCGGRHQSGDAPAGLPSGISGTNLGHSNRICLEFYAESTLDLYT